MVMTKDEMIGMGLPIPNENGMVEQRSMFSDIPILGDLYDEIRGIDKTNVQGQQQEYLLQKEQEFALKMEQIQEEYNSESARMKRMQEAGLNVNLMSAAAGDSSVGMQSSPSAPSVAGLNGGFLNDLLTAWMNSIENKKANSQIQLMDSQARLNDVESMLRPLSTYAQIKVWDSTVKKFEEEAGLSHENAQFVRSKRLFFSDTMDIQKGQLIAEWNKLEAEAAGVRQQIKESVAREKLYGAQEDLTVQQSINEQVQGEILGQQKESAEIDLLYKKAAQKFANQYMDGLPLDNDSKIRLARMALSDDEYVRNQANLMMNAFDKAIFNEENAKNRNAWEYYKARWTWEEPHRVGQFISGIVPFAAGIGQSAGASPVLPPFGGLPR